MSEYKIVRDENGEVRILDHEGKPVDMPTAWLLIGALSKVYQVNCSVYVGQNPVDGLWKIGISRNVARRAEQLNIVVKYVIRCQTVQEARFVEAHLHAYCAEHGQRVHGEWFLLPEDTIRTITSESWPVAVTYELTDAIKDNPEKLGYGIEIMRRAGNLFLRRAEEIESVIRRQKEDEHG